MGDGPVDRRVRVVGVGNRYRGDDGAGLAAAKRLGAAANVPVTLLDAIGDGTALLEVWRDADTVVVLDAMNSGAAAGTVRRLDGSADGPATLAEILGAGRTETAENRDASCRGQEPTIHGRRLSSRMHGGSTHGLGVAEAIALGGALGRLPRRLVVIGIEGARFDAGEGLSPEVDRALDHAVALGLEEIARVHRAAR